MSSIGSYAPGNSWIHRAPAHAKLLLLVVSAAVCLLIKSGWLVGGGLLLVLCAYVAAGLGLGAAVRQVRPVIPALALIAAFHVMVSGWGRASLTVSTIAVLVLLAGLMTLTTRTLDLIEALERGLQPMRRVGVNPGSVALMLALGIRSVSVVITLAGEVRDAQRARGLEASPRAFAVPLIVRALAHADELADALRARGFED